MNRSGLHKVAGELSANYGLLAFNSGMQCGIVELAIMCPGKVIGTSFNGDKVQKIRGNHAFQRVKNMRCN